MTDELAGRIEGWVDALCTTFPDRHVGGPGNRAATGMFAETARGYGFDVSVTDFDAVDWEHGDAELAAGGERFEVLVGPYSPPFDGEAVLVAASTVEELETDAIRGAIVLMHGELVSSQLMPKNFVFYNPDSHKRVIRALEEYEPAAIVAATGLNPGSAGALYPFPIIEDADFDIPSAYMKDVEGDRLLAHAGEPVTLRFESRRTTVQGEHVVARMLGDQSGRVVVFGHIDTREGTPGALDNAGDAVKLRRL